MLQDSAERLGQDIIQYEESLGSIVEAAKSIASMWRKMAHLIRSELSTGGYFNLYKDSLS